VLSLCVCPDSVTSLWVALGKISPHLSRHVGVTFLGGMGLRDQGLELAVSSLLCGLGLNNSVVRVQLMPTGHWRAGRSKVRTSLRSLSNAI
jgi:hypothetical protein